MCFDVVGFEEWLGAGAMEQPKEEAQRPLVSYLWPPRQVAGRISGQ